MDGVGTPIIERPRPLPGHDTPNPTHHTLNYEEPVIRARKPRNPDTAKVQQMTLLNPIEDASVAQACGKEHCEAPQ